MRITLAILFGLCATAWSEEAPLEDPDQAAMVFRATERNRAWREWVEGDRRAEDAGEREEPEQAAHSKSSLLSTAGTTRVSLPILAGAATLRKCPRASF